jgi:lipopolysaccharide cholinephosphotransferase
MKRATVEQVRKLQLELLNKLDVFCKENEIQYYAFAGTLLGAVRHKGFIPWDNDIDVAVSRDDYSRMQEILATEDSNDYFRFLCYENDPEYLWQHGRIVAKHTFMKTARGYKKLGLSIDVFPLDSQGNNVKDAKQNLLEIKRCVQLRIMSYEKKYKVLKYPNCNEEEKKALISMFAEHDQEEYWVRRHIELAKKFNDKKDSIYYGCNSNDKYTVVCKRDQYRDVVYLDFEDTKIPAPVGYDEILQEYYGDYMKLPNKDKQVGAQEMEIYLI